MILMRPSFFLSFDAQKLFAFGQWQGCLSSFFCLSFERRRCWIRNQSRKAIVNITTPCLHSGTLQLRLAIFVPVTKSDLISECANCAQNWSVAYQRAYLVSSYFIITDNTGVYARKPPLLSNDHLLLTDAVIRSSACLASPLPLFAWTIYSDEGVSFNFSIDFLCNSIITYRGFKMRF